MINIENMICDAIELIAERAVAAANYDKTVQATVVSCVDSDTGKYKCKYLDSTIYAFASSSNTTYTKGSQVYILIPGNDMSKTKTILGEVDKISVKSAQQSSALDQYQTSANLVRSKDTASLGTFTLGTSVIGDGGVDNTEWPFLTYKQTQNTFTLYKKGATDNKISLEENYLTYINKSDYIVCGATFTSALEKFDPNDSTRAKLGGDFGIIFKLSTDNENEVKTYTVNLDMMINNPYNLDHIPQYAIFSTMEYGKTATKPSHTAFTAVEEISLFASGFDNEGFTSEEACLLASNIIFEAADKLTAEELADCGLKFITRNGTIFEQNTTSLPINVQILQNGKVLNNPENLGIDCYWFIEDDTITPNSEKYFALGGRRWRCVNEFSTSYTEDSDEETISYATKSFTHNFNKIDFLSNSRQIKCVILYNGVKYQKTLTLTNQYPDYGLTLVPSPQKTNLYEVSTEMSLICKVTHNEEIVDSGLDYYWSYTADDNATVNLTDNINEIYFYPSMFSNVLTYSCTVCAVSGDSKTQLGTKTITFTKQVEVESDLCSLFIENGNRIYKYDENGLSPAADNQIGQVSVDELAVHLYDKNGEEINLDSHADIITWYLPKTKTMLSVSSLYPGNYSESTDDYYTYHSTAFAYDIANNFNYNSINNQIKVEVNYKDIEYTAYTNFLFVKEGQNGTNGTDLAVKLIASNTAAATEEIVSEAEEADDNVEETKEDLSLTGRLPIINLLKTEINTSEGADFELIYYTGNNVRKVKSGKYKTPCELPFEIQLFENGMLVSNDGAYSYSINMLRNAMTYGDEWENIPLFSVKSDTNGDWFTIDPFDKDSGSFVIPNELVLNYLVTYQNSNLYLTQPFIVSTVNLENNDSTYIEVNAYNNNTFVEYTSSGDRPKYNTSLPISLSNYEWQETDSYSVISPNGDLWVKQKDDKSLFIVPKTNYSGACVSNIIQINILEGAIYIPIYMYLNRYGLANINEWDGNSLQINDDGGYILAPQVGAGHKNDDNSFSGLIIGDVVSKNSYSQNQTNTGLFGFYNGERSVFIDAESGRVELGTGSKIIIDPTNSQQHSVIQSSSFQLPNPYSEDVEERKGKGFQIDLDEPSITYGNGNFKVDKKGCLTANYAKIGANSVIYNSQGDEIEIENLVDNASFMEYDYDSGALYIKKRGATNAPFIKITADGIELCSTSSKVDAYLDQNGFKVKSGIVTDSLTLGATTTKSGTTQTTDSQWIWKPSSNHLRLTYQPKKSEKTV